MKICLRKDKSSIKHVNQLLDNDSNNVKNSESIKISDYTIRQTIGFGGFAKVKRAIHNPTGLEVAVKVINLHKITEQRVKHIILQIDIHKKLIHSNIAKIYEVYQDSNNIYIFMEFCSGGELFDYISKNGPLPVDVAAKIFKQIHSAVSYLHQISIAHRDIKTQNILLDENFNAKLIDFGMANYITDTQNSDMMLKTFCGSPCYISPQMIKKRPYDAKMVDIWCLGVTLYVMLTATLPFHDKDIYLLREKIKKLEYHKILIPYVGQLIDKIFKYASQRINLQLIQQSDFYVQSKPCQTRYLLPQQQSFAIDYNIIEKMMLRKNISKEQIIQNIKKGYPNQIYGMYYIQMQKSRRQGYESCYNVNSYNFMKKRGSVIDLNSIKLNKNRKNSLSLIPFKALQPLAEDYVQNKNKILRLITEDKQKIYIKRINNENYSENPKRMIDYPKRYTKNYRLGSQPMLG